MENRTDAELIRRRLDRGWTLWGLGARGPASPIRRELALFGQFVGDWEIFSGPTEKPPPGDARPKGKVHWRWVLGGLAVQDVWGHVEPRSGTLVPQGSTIRFYDDHIAAWRSTWISPYQRKVRRFIGRAEREEIVLRERGRGRQGEHWIFSEIGKDSFRWRAETRRGPNRAWTITQDYWIRRSKGLGR